MKWWPSRCQKGDMIRVRIGSVYHYGIFVSEAEVIAFGPAPTAENFGGGTDFRVIATDIEDFACGAIVEVAKPETREEKRRFSPSKTVKLAKEKLGEGGYDIIRNNCEHFVNLCVYGVARSSQTDDLRHRFHDRSLLHVYLMRVDPDVSVTPVIPAAREEEIQSARGALKIQRYTAWKALEIGISHAFGRPISELSFHKTPEGRWSAEEYGISLSHAEDLVAVAVSDRAVGVDLESIEHFAYRHAAEAPEKFAHRFFTEKELALYQAPSHEQMLSIWTKKESIFKHRGTGHFEPQSIDSTAFRTATRAFTLDKHYLLSVCAERPEELCCYLIDGGKPCRLQTEKS